MTGICGVVSPDNCLPYLYLATDYSFHLGSKHGGLCLLNPKGEWKRANHSIQDAQFQTKFSRYLMDDSWIGKMGIGVISDLDVQPLVLNTRFGTIAIAFNGWINNLNQLVEKYIAKGHSPIVMSLDPDNANRERIYSVSLLATLINEAKTLESGIQHVWEIIEGSASMLILTPDGIIAARDLHGRTPLVIAYNSTTKSRIIVSEDFFLFRLGYKVEKSLEPGEIVCISASGVQVLCSGNCELCQFCTFSLIYTSFPASTRVASTRIMCGESLAQKSGLTAADMVCGIPDSGIFSGQGFAKFLQIPYIQAIIKYAATRGRSFIPGNQAQRDDIAKHKLHPSQELLMGLVLLVLTDDSIVRATQLGDLIWEILELLGVKRVHLGISCPPLLFPCNYLYSTRRRGELATRKVIGDQVKDLAPYLDPDSRLFQDMIRGIKESMLRGKTAGDRWNLPDKQILDVMDRFTLQYQRPEDMIKVVTTVSGLAQKDLCFDCWFPRTL
ncbi:hypothetical protein ACFL14_01260 [Patescibacteria group bacterium]